MSYTPIIHLRSNPARSSYITTFSSRKASTLNRASSDEDSASRQGRRQDQGIFTANDEWSGNTASKSATNQSDVCRNCIVGIGRRAF